MSFKTSKSPYLKKELTDQHKTSLQDILEGYRNVLGALDKALDEYNGLDGTPKSFGNRSQRVLRFKWVSRGHVGGHGALAYIRPLD